ncbi:MAG: PD40 domain-containing protein [Bacteroidetes bacterium]|nr:PD40 domain-containing protein [Bacteroidota bacterium]
MKKKIIFIGLFIFCSGLFLYAQKKSPSKKQTIDSVTTTIANLGKTINTTFSEYAPVISADGGMLVFTSRRPVTEKEINKRKQGMENIYLSYYDEKKKKWGVAKRLSESINQPGRHNSAIALSNDGQRMLLYRDDNSGNGDIYESNLEGEEWSEPVKLPSPINTDDHESSASISPDGHTIYFVSNRKGGQGGRDIWMCKQDQKGEWGRVKNLGSVINTSEDEEGVFIHPDGKTLYFSSKGHNGMGGYDIFKSVFENGKWNQPASLGVPVNTTDDDLYFVITADGKIGYYASAKSGGIGEKDIYKIFPVEKKKNKGPKLTLFKGIVIDKGTFDPLESDIEITDNEKNEIISKIKSNSATGKFLISLPSGKNYGINVRKEGYLFYSDNVSISDTAAYKEIDKTIPLEKINVGSKIVLRNIFHDFDQATLRDESISEMERLVQLLSNNPTMKIELSSHTDSKGTDEYNMKLSQARAQSVVDYLISKDISKDRLVAKGYGESQPVAANDTEDGRQMNRRTEFTILEK